VFDNPIDASLTAEFLSDPRHHLAVAIDGDVVVGMASAVHYVHPDKPAELWINEVGVSRDYRGRGIAGHMLDALFALGKELGCLQAWVLTDRTNTPAVRLYESSGGHAAPGNTVMYEFPLGA
jgi:ribosomal protein S18 acetylase RimI-like enzyme